jgi:hypothetical protein
MSEQGTVPGATPGAMQQGGATPPEPGASGAMPPAQLPTEREPEREAPPRESEPEDEREAQLGEEGRRLLRDERRARKDAEKRLKTLEDADKARRDAAKTDLERVTEERDALKAERDALLRKGQATEVAAEFGIAEWADELAGDEDTRTMRDHARKIRERLGRSAGPGMDGGVRGLGLPPQPQSMDDLIRQGVRR